MGEFNVWTIFAGVIAYGTGVFVCLGPMMLGNYLWLKSRWTKDVNEEELLRNGHRSIAIHLGSLFICQAILARHAVYVVTQVVRNLFIYKYPLKDAVWLLSLCLVFLALIGSLALLSLRIAEWTFKKLTGELEENDEIKRDNIAVAIFSALVMLAITLVLNEGLGDFARSLIPLGRSVSPW